MLDERLRLHVPSDAARRRARAEGLDLEALKRDAPREYMMLNASEVLRAAPELSDLAGSMLLAAFPEREVFRAPAGAQERLLAFPPLQGRELARLDALLAPLVDRPEWRRRHAFYREVADTRGRLRELALATPPAAYRDGNAVVGPFESEQDADAWGREHVGPPRVHDRFPMNGAWFCDIFTADDDG